MLVILRILKQESINIKVIAIKKPNITMFMFLNLLEIMEDGKIGIWMKYQLKNAWTI